MTKSIGPIAFNYREKKYIGYLISSRGRNVRIKICYGALVFSVPEKLIERYERRNLKESMLTMFSKGEESTVNYVPLFVDYMNKLNIESFLKKKKIQLSGEVYLCDNHIYLLGKKHMVKYGFFKAKPGEFVAKNRKSLESLYREKALNYLSKRTQELAAVMEVPFKVEVGLSKANNYLGMNNIKLNRIVYNPALYSYDPAFSDAIVIHELAHCFAHGHGKDFYAIIQKYCPRYKEYSSYISSGIFNIEMAR